MVEQIIKIKAGGFIGVYIRNCKQIIKKSKKIAQFIGVYIRNSEGFT